MKNFRLWAMRNKEALLVGCLWLLALIYRLYFTYKNYGFIYYDEIYQSKEMAHHWVHGYGHVPWEFHIPRDLSEEGMARSPLHALIYMAVMLPAKWLDCPWRSVLHIIQGIDAFVASLIVPFSYYLFKRLFVKPSILPWLGAALAVSNFWLVYLGVHSFSNIYYAPLFFAALILLLDLPWTSGPDGQKSGLTKPIKKHFWAGFLLGFAVTLRFDALLFVGIILALFYTPPIKTWRPLISNFTGGLLLSGGIISGLIDFVAFGHFWVSTKNSFVYNVIEKKSILHVNEPFGWYFNQLFGDHPALFNLFVFSSIVLVLEVAWWIHSHQKTKPAEGIAAAATEAEKGGALFSFLRPHLFDQLRLFLFLIGSILMISTNPSKQLRFLYPLLPFIYLFVLCGPLVVIVEIERFFRRINPRQLEKNTGRLVATFLIAIVCAGFLLQGLRANRSLWKNIDSQLYKDVMMSMVWVGEQEDSRGLIVLGDWARAGGMYHLHKNIPVHYDGRDAQRSALTAPLLTSGDIYHYNYAVIPIEEKIARPELINLLWNTGYRPIHYEHKNCEVWRYVEPYLLPDQIPPLRYWPCDEWKP